MISEMFPVLTIQRGNVKILHVNLSNVDMITKMAFFTIIDKNDKVVLQLELTQQGVNQILLSSKFTSTLKDNKYWYDVVTAKRDEKDQRIGHRQLSEIIILPTAGGYRNE